MKYKILLIMAALLLVVPMVQGLTAKKGDSIDLKIPCTFQDSPCLATATCNLTLNQPNNTYIADNQLMSISANGDANYTQGTWGSLGDHQVKVFCSQSGFNATSTFDVLVTQTGTDQSTAQGLGSLAFLILMIALTGLFGWIGFRLTESQTLWILGVFMLFLAVLFVIYDVWLGYEYQVNLTGANAMATSYVPEIIFYIFLFLVVAGFLSCVGLLFLRWKEVFRYLKKEIKRKDDDEDLDDEFGVGKFEK